MQAGKTVVLKEKKSVEANTPGGGKHLVGLLSARIKHPGDAEWRNLGLLCSRIVTDAAIADLIAVMQGGGATDLQNYKYHGTGTGSNAESAADTTLQTEVESRDTGTQLNPSGGVYRTVATHTYAGANSITEHGVFSDPTTGILLDRSVFPALPTVLGTQIEWTYDLTATGS